MRRRFARFSIAVSLFGIAACSGGGCKSCKKESKPESIPLPPSPGGASQDLVNTRIGTGLGFGSGLAPTSTKWERVFVTGPKTAIVAGRSLDEAIALRTADGGHTWQTLRTKPGKFSSWGAGEDGSVALIGGETKKAKLAAGQLAPVLSSQVWFAAKDRTLSEPAPLFPNNGKLTDIGIESGFSMPAVLSGELAGIVTNKGRSPTVVFGAPGGQPQPAPVDGGRDKIVTAPYGRPAQLVTMSRGSINVQPWPKSGGRVESGKSISGIGNVVGAYETLSKGPGCEHMGWSFARVGNGSTAWIVGISATRTFAFKAPAGNVQEIGCGSDAVVVQTFDDEKNVPTLQHCTFDGTCTKPKSQPFDIWAEPHDQDIKSGATKQGVVAVLTAKSGARWGTYLATSMDSGKTFDLPRVIGEGSADRGFFEVGALIVFPERVVILMSADVTGTRRRGWYALASDDSGKTWREP